MQSVYSEVENYESDYNKMLIPFKPGRKPRKITFHYSNKKEDSELGLSYLNK